MALRRLIWSLLAVVAGAMLLAALVLDLSPTLAPPHAATAQELSQGHRLLRRHDPRRARPGGLYVVRLSVEELNLLSTHVARLLGGAAAIQLQAHRLDAQASLPVPRLPGSFWLNVQATLVEGPGLPELHHLKVGRLTLPAPWAQMLARRLLNWIDGPDDGPPLHRMIRQFTLWPHQLHVVYQWRADVPAQVLARLVPSAQREAVRIYTVRLAQLAGSSKGPLELGPLLSAMAQLALERSTNDASAAEENRAWLRALTFYVNGHNVVSMMPNAGNWPKPARRQVTLLGRDDFPQHFLVSALLSAEGGGPLAEALGLSKEVEDARSGSGFSFTDVAANRAGQRFGTHAMSAPRQLQQALAKSPQPSAWMPQVDDLPEFLSESQFQSRFGGLAAPAYAAQLSVIDERIRNLALYR